MNYRPVWIFVNLALAAVVLLAVAWLVISISMWMYPHLLT